MQPARIKLNRDTQMNYVERDNYGIYALQAEKKGPGPRLMGADTLMGNDVYNKQGEELGRVKEIMLDVQNGRVCYAVLSFGGFMGVGEKLFAVPWEALVLDTVNQRFTLDVQKDRLLQAPGFDKENWPNMSNGAWSEGLHHYYGTQPYADHMR